MSGCAMRLLVGSFNVLCPGALWGEEHLLLSYLPLLDDNSAMALLFVQCQELSKKKFESVLEDHPDHYARIRDQVARTALTRGIKLHVKKMKQLQRHRESSSSDRYPTESLDPSPDVEHHVMDSLSRTARSQKRLSDAVSSSEQMLRSDSSLGKECIPVTPSGQSLDVEHHLVDSSSLTARSHRRPSDAASTP